MKEPSSAIGTPNEVTGYVAQRNCTGETLTKLASSESNDKFRLSFDCTLRAELSFDPLRKHRDFMVGRALVCPCFERNYWSVTIRKDDSLQRIGDSVPIRLSDFLRSPTLSEWPERKSKQDLIDEILFNLLTKLNPSEAGKEHVGLLVISGRTGSRKTTKARELARLFVSPTVKSWVEKQSRRPHIVTFEDPIESKFAPDPLIAGRHGFDYTPRQKGQDANTLQEALSDALRQTPALFYVGETRNQDDWRALLHFAGTGHLAITTTHAGSVVETVEHILTALGAKTPAARGAVVRRLLGVIHLRRFDDKILPSLWRRTEVSVNALVAEGLSALRPTGLIGDQLTERSEGCVGRYSFVKTFADQLSLGDSISSQAFTSDLEIGA